MSEDIKTISDMIRTTSENTTEFMRQVADHVDKLETTVVQLQQHITELESKNVAE